MMPDKDITRFWSKVAKGAADQCWPWIGGTFSHGYGQFKTQRKSRPASRVAFELANGVTLSPTIFVCHRCDNKLCCNPAHLYAGSHADNVRDAVERRRFSQGDTHYSRTEPWRLARGDRNGSRTKPERLMRGVDNYQARLNPQRVIAIREKYAAGATMKALGFEYGVSRPAIAAVVYRRTWTHVT